MSWVRISSGAMSHPKIVKLSDKAFRLWVWSLSYAQQHLTDGRLPAGTPYPARLRRSMPDLVKWGLWDVTEPGVYLIHDYLDWNNSKGFVHKKRDEARQRMESVRERTSLANGVERTTPTNRAEPVRARTGGANSPISYLASLSSSSVLSSEKGSGEKPTTARSHRPVFDGQRLTVFEWMLDDCLKTLGPHADAFDLHAWFYELDDHAVKAGLVIAKRDGGSWLQAQLVAEAQRRGLPLAMATTTPTSKRITELAAGTAAFLKRHEP